MDAALPPRIPTGARHTVIAVAYAQVVVLTFTLPLRPAFPVPTRVHHLRARRRGSALCTTPTLPVCSYRIRVPPPLRLRLDGFGFDLTPHAPGTVIRYSPLRWRAGCGGRWILRATRSTALTFIVPAHTLPTTLTVTPLPPNTPRTGCPTDHPPLPMCPRPNASPTPLPSTTLPPRHHHPPPPRPA